MASATASATAPKAEANTSQLPKLPPNVSIFSPPSRAVSQALLSQGRIFTRLTISASANSNSNSNTARVNVSDSLKRRPGLADQSFWLVHQNAVVLVFTGSGAEGGPQQEEEDEEKVKDRHHEQVRSVCLALKDGDWSLSIAGCVFDAVGAAGAGFQFDRLSGGAVLVVDLMDGGEDDEEEEEEEEEDDGDFNLLAGAEVVD